MALLPQLKLSAPKRSNFDLSYVNRFTAAPGVLIPAMVQRCLPGDHFEISVSHLVKTMALKAPLMGRMSVKFDFFFVPDRLYVPAFRNNNVNVGIMDVAYPNFSLPTVGQGAGSSTPDSAKYELASSHILDYLGLPVGFADRHAYDATAPNGRAAGAVKFNAIPYLAYLDIWRNYYRNPQESDAYMVGAFDEDATNVPPTSTSDDYYTAYINQFNVSDTIDDLINNVSSGRVTNFDNVLLSDQFADSEVFRKVFNVSGLRTPMSGLLLRCYQPDYYSNFINESIYNQVTNYGGFVVTQDDGFTINQFRLANKLQKLAERSIIAGNRYGEFIRALFGVKTDDKLDIPEYLGSTSTTMQFNDVAQQQANTTEYDPANGKYPLGQSAGRGLSVDNSRKFYINATEYGHIFCMFSLVPTPDYYEGISKFLRKLRLSDEFNPQLDRLGWQALYDYEYNAVRSEGVWEDGNDPFTSALAYQPAWLEYMTRTNELHGEFATTLNFWTIGRTFNRDTSGLGGDAFSVTPSAYIFPNDFSVPFVDESLTAQNFLVQCKFDIFAKRPISKKLMPNLG